LGWRHDSASGFIYPERKVDAAQVDLDWSKLNQLAEFAMSIERSAR